MDRCSYTNLTWPLNDHIKYLLSWRWLPAMSRLAVNPTFKSEADSDLGDPEVTTWSSGKLVWIFWPQIKASIVHKFLTYSLTALQGLTLQRTKVWDVKSRKQDHTCTCRVKYKGRHYICTLCTKYDHQISRHKELMIAQMTKWPLQHLQDIGSTSYSWNRVLHLITVLAPKNLSRCF